MKTSWSSWTFFGVSAGFWGVLGVFGLTHTWQGTWCAQARFGEDTLNKEGLSRILLMPINQIAKEKQYGREWKQELLNKTELSTKGEQLQLPLGWVPLQLLHVVDHRHLLRGSLYGG